MGIEPHVSSLLPANLPLFYPAKAFIHIIFNKLFSLNNFIYNIDMYK